MIVVLRWGDCDGGEDYYFISPEGTGQKEFSELCDKLVGEAARLALGKQNDWLGWEEIVARLAILLTARGRLHGHSRRTWRPQGHYQPEHIITQGVV